MGFIKDIQKIFKVHLSIKRKVVDKLISVSTPNGDFLILLLLSVLIVNVGLTLDNIFLVIGGMMVTPLLYPVLATGLGIAIWDWKLFSRSISSFILSCLVSVIASYIVSSVFFSLTEISTGMVKNIEPRLAYFVIAIFAGIAASITWVRSNLSAALPGVGVTVTLVPPLATIGMGIAIGDWVILGNALSLFGISFIGIVIPTAIIFFAMKFEAVEKQVDKSIKKEDGE